MWKRFSWREIVFLISPPHSVQKGKKKKSSFFLPIHTTVLREKLVVPCWTEGGSRPNIYQFHTSFFPLGHDVDEDSCKDLQKNLISCRHVCMEHQQTEQNKQFSVFLCCYPLVTWMFVIQIQWWYIICFKDLQTELQQMVLGVWWGRRSCQQGNKSLQQVFHIFVCINVLIILHVS